MPFTIVAERHGVSIYNRRSAAREALFLASSRVREGAEKVLVYDETGQFISASALSEAARNRIGTAREVEKAVDDAVAELLTLEPRSYDSSGGLTIAVRSEPVSSPMTVELVDSNSQPTKPGRVRVFRATRKRD